MRQPPSGITRRPDARAARRVRHDLREPAQRHRSRPPRSPSRAATPASCAAARRRSHSNMALLRLRAAALADAGLPADGGAAACETTDRAAVGQLIAMPEYVDVIIPRGGKGLIERISREAQGAGHQAPGRQLPRLCRRRGRPRAWRCASPTTPRRRSTAPATRPSRCWCTRRRRRPSCRSIGARLSRPRASRCAATRAAQALLAALPGASVAATEQDWSEEYLAPIISIKVVDWPRRGDRAHQPLRLAPHRRHPHRATIRTRCASCARSIRPA